MAHITFNQRTIGPGHPTYIIAEIGINHQGDVTLAKKLIEAAKESGADAVKFQKRSISRILTKEGLDMPYDNRNSFGATYGEHKKALELSEENYAELFTHAQNAGVDFCASGWDEESIDFLNNLGVFFFKMASADLTNIPLLDHTARLGKPMFLSTGMANMDQVYQAVETVKQHQAPLAVLQCTSTYPTDFEEIHLNVLSTFQDAFPHAVIGYSGHELGIAIPAVAVALGAKIIERHFTLDRTMKGGDHAASLEPQGFAKMVRDIRHVESAMGFPEKNIQSSEEPVFKKLAKSIVSTQSIPSGTIISREMLTTKGPGTGISPTQMDEIVGKTAKNNISIDVVIQETDLY